MFTVVDEHGVVETAFESLVLALDYQEMAGDAGETVYVVDDAGSEY